MPSDLGVKNTAVPETSALKSTLDAGSQKNTVVPENNGLKNIPDEGCIPKNTSDDELDDDMLLLAGKKYGVFPRIWKSNFHFPKTTQ